MRPSLALAATLVFGVFGYGWAGQYHVTEVHDPATGRFTGVASIGSIIVQFKPDADAARRAAVHALLGSSESRNLGAPGLYEIILPSGVHPDSALIHYSASPIVEAAYPNHIYHISKTPNDPKVPQQYALSQINAFGAWEYETGFSSPVTVAIMDTGVDSAHEEFAGKFDAVNSKTFCPSIPANCPGTCVSGAGADLNGHGTGVAGIAAANANNGAGIAGMSWGATVVSIKVFNDDGTCGDDASITAGINYAATLTALTGRRTVLNMSLGSCTAPGNPSTCGDCNAAQITAVNNAVAANTVLIAAAGNQSPAQSPFGNVECPGKIPGVIPVGATDSGQNIASFSCRGPELAAHGVVAPGVGVLLPAPGNSYTSENGTSQASPHVAGLAALLLSAKPALTPAQVESTIRGSATLIGPSSLSAFSVKPAGNSQGAGRADAFMAMRLAIHGTLADFQGKQKAIAFPNPFRLSDTGTVTITVPDGLVGGNTKIKIYTLGGQLVRALSGQTWDGKNDAGQQVASGTYMFLVSTDNGKATGRVALIR